MPESLYIRLLGGFDIVQDGRRLDGLQSLRFQRFLALVTLRDGAQHRSRLAFELWPDSTDAQARTNLRKLLHDFRQALPGCEAFIDIGAAEVRWRDGAPVTVDVLEFRRAILSTDPERAAAAYTGDLLPACYDDWVLEERASLRTDALTTFARLIEAAAGRKEPESVIACARRVLELEPTDESAICHQIEAHRALGDRNAAMRAYHHFSNAMERELGVAPGEAVQELYRQIRSGYAQPTENRHPDAIPAAEVPAAGAPFVGRDTELGALHVAWTAARTGAALLVLVAGEPGIGKSRLANELARRAQTDGHSVVMARAYEAAGRLPWGPVVDLLRSEALRDRISTLDPVWRAELSRLLPELAVQDGRSAEGRPADPVQRHRLFDAVRHALVSPERPRLLVIDDLQWCDTETIELIGYVIRSEPGAPMLIVGTVRSEEVSELHPLTRLTDALESEGAVTTLRLDRLDMDATATLSARMRDADSVDPDFVSWLWTETMGNPLFLVETLRAEPTSDGLRSVLTPTMRAVMRARLSRLSESARRLAEMAAVIGRAFSLDLIAAATGIDEHQLIDGVDELWQRRIIREEGVRYDFSHDKLREVALEMISPARGRLLHRATARALAATHSSDLTGISPQLAAHYDQAGMIERAIESYRAAGAGAVAVSAFDEAVDHFERALTLLAELPTSPARDRRELDIRIALGSPLVALEGYGAERAHRLYERAMALCQELGRPVGPPILRGLGLARLQGCRFADCSGFGRALVNKGADDCVAVTEGRYLLGVSAFWQGDLARSRAHLEKAIGNYDPAHARQHLALYAQDPRAVCLVRLGLVDLWQGDPGQADANARAAQAVAEDLGHLMTRGYVITYAAIMAAEAGDFGRLGAFLADGQELSKRFSMRYLSLVLESLRGWVDLHHGDDRGIERITMAVERSRAEGENLHLTYMLLLLARAHRRQGDAGPALEAVQEGLALTSRHGQHYLEAEFRRLDGELALAADDGASARAALSQAATVARTQGARWSELRARTSLARHFPDDPTLAGLAALLKQLPSGHDLPAFRAAADVLGRHG